MPLPRTARLSRSAILAATAVISALHAPLRAQQSPSPELPRPSADTAKSYALTPMTVTAGRTRAPLATATAAVSVIGGAELRRAPVRTLADALHRVPGLAFLDLDGLGMNPVPTVRGFYGGGEAEYVVVLLDGKPVNALQSGVVPWELIPVSAIERVEVVRGGASSLFGDAALGGVVNVVTRGEGAGRARWSVSGGELASWRGSANVSAARGSLFGDVQRTDGFRAHSGRTAAVAGGSLPFALGRRGTLTLSAASTWRAFDEPGSLAAAQLDGSRTQSDAFYRFDHTRDRLHRIGIETTNGFGSAASLTGYLAGEYRRTDAVRTNVLAPGFADTQARGVRAMRLLGSAQSELPGFLVPAGRLLLGTDFSAGSARSEYRSVAGGGTAEYAAASGTPGAVYARGTGTRVAAAGFAQYELRPVDAVRLSLGGRLDWLRDAFDPAVPDTLASTRVRHTAFSPRAGVNLRVLRAPGQEGHVYLTAGRSFKAATLDQLYDQRSYPVPFPPYAISTSNPLLAPQRGSSVEAGLYHQASLGRGVFTEASFAAYRMEMRDELDFDVQKFRYVNLGRSRHAGIESSARVRTAPASFFAAYTLQAVTSRAGENRGRALKAIPRHFLSAGADGALLRRLDAGISASRAWGIWVDDANTVRLPAFTRVDGRLAYPVRGLRVTVDAYNLFDRKYSTTGFMDAAGSGTVYYFPASGRTIQVGISTAF
ncbi:MAG: hypothetical protein JWM27_3799 [Gemmatimonadetes bacterium]|nr:hypothetical protein [Gemmatimonadota bacterium]